MIINKPKPKPNDTYVRTYAVSSIVQCNHTVGTVRLQSDSEFATANSFSLAITWNDFGQSEYIFLWWSRPAAKASERDLVSV